MLATGSTMPFGATLRASSVPLQSSLNFAWYTTVVPVRLVEFADKAADEPEAS